jgi:hypothetical protein
LLKIHRTVDSVRKRRCCDNECMENSWAGNLWEANRVAVQKRTRILGRDYAEICQSNRNVSLSSVSSCRRCVLHAMKPYHLQSTQRVYSERKVLVLRISQYLGQVPRCTCRSTIQHPKLWTLFALFHPAEAPGLNHR